MNTPAFTFSPASTFGLRNVALGLVVGLVSLSALAQGVYRIVGPDGRVSFSDQPQPSANARPVTGNTSGASASGAQLPFELRQISSRYPVTLYTSAECAPCNSGRNLLNARGIPYTEKTLSTAEDAEALKRLTGQASLPFLTIGSQQIKGYSDGEWTPVPGRCRLPQTIGPCHLATRRAAATPLVAVQAAAGPAPSAPAQQPAASTEPPVAPAASNPAGIRF